MTKLHEFLRWSVIAGVLGLGTACGGSTEVPLDPAVAAGMTPAAARATLVALKAAGGQTRAVLWIGNPDLYADDLSDDRPDFYPVHYLVESIAVGPQQIWMRSRVVSKRADNGSEKIWYVPLRATRPSLRLDHYSNEDVPVVALYATDTGPELTFEGTLDEAGAQRVLAALVERKQAAVDEKAAFARALAAWRAASPRPVPGEDLRHLAVQAKGAVRDKDFYAAEEFYAQGLEIAPWWPEGRYNRALLFAAIGDYADAVLEMQRFLALAPETPNGRALQDEIYDWQRKAQAQ